jgi:uncharacterized protein YbjQ (UPF0145 family)
MLKLNLNPKKRKIRLNAPRGNKEGITMECEKCKKDYPSALHLATKTICRECYDKMTTEEKLKASQPKAIYALSTTAFSIDGYKIVKSLGVVRGVLVRSRSVFGTIGASLQTLVGGNITLFSELCERTRADAYDMMVEHAEDIGANAVIGIRYDTTEIMSGVTEVLCYGTAVIVKPVS